MVCALFFFTTTLWGMLGSYSWNLNSGLPDTSSTVYPWPERDWLGWSKLQAWVWTFNLRMPTWSFQPSKDTSSLVLLPNFSPEIYDFELNDFVSKVELMLLLWIPHYLRGSLLKHTEGSASPVYSHSNSKRKEIAANCSFSNSRISCRNSSR